MRNFIYDVIDKGYILIGILIILTVFGTLLSRIVTTMDVRTLILIFLVGATVGSPVALFVLTAWFFVRQWRRGK